MTLTIKDSPEVTGTSKSGSSGQSSGKSPAQSLRSDPVCLEVPVVVRSLPGEGGNAPGASGPTRQEGRSVIVFDNGGVLRLANPLPVGQKVILTNPQGRDVVGRVVGGRNLPSIKGYIEVEFIEPVNDFWQIHKALDANRVSPAAPMDHADEASALDSLTDQRVAPPPPPRPIVAAPERIAPSSSAPSFEDIAGVISMSPVSVPPEKKIEKRIEPEIASASAPLNEPLAQFPIEQTNSISTSKPPVSFSEMVAENSPETTTHSVYSAPSRKQPSSNDFSGKVASFSGMSSLPVPEESRGRMPLLLGGAALVLAAIGGGYFFLHRGASPNAAPPAAVVASQPFAPPAADVNSVPANAPAAEPAVEQAAHQAAQAVPAVASASADVAAPAPSTLQNARLRANPIETQQPDRTAPRRPLVPSLKMSSPTSPAKNLAASSNESSPGPVDIAMNTAPGETSTGALGARTDKPPAPPAEIAPPRPARVVQEAKLISSTRPVYPALAKQTNSQGRVIIDASIDEKGNVVSAKAVSGPIPLRQAALDAVKQWKYSPAQIDGKPSSSVTTIGVDFRLN